MISEETKKRIEKHILERCGSHEKSWTYEMMLDGAILGHALATEERDAEIVNLKEQILQKNAQIFLWEKRCNEISDVFTRNERLKAAPQIIKVDKMVNTTQRVDFSSGFEIAVEIMKKREDELFDRICEELKINGAVIYIPIVGSVEVSFTPVKMKAEEWLSANKARIIGNE